MEPTLLLSDSEISDKALDAFTLETAKALFEAHGFLKMGNLFPREWIQMLGQAFLGQIANDSMKIPSRAKRGGRPIVSIPFAPPFNQSDLYANPILLSLMRAFLGPDCILGRLGAALSLPGAKDQSVHSDFEHLFQEQPFLTAVHAPFAIAVEIPLVDIDATSGATKIWSATHRAIELDKKKIDREYERHLLDGPMGSCYFWDYRTYHAGGANQSEILRPLLYLSYTRRWFRDLNHPERVIQSHEEIPKEHARLFPETHFLTAAKEDKIESKIQSLFDGKP